MVDVDDEGPDADEQQQQRERHAHVGDERHTVLRLGADGPQDQQRVGERADEDREHRLVDPVGDEASEHARRELAAGELEGDDRHGEDRPGHGDEASGDRREHAPRAFGAAAEQPQAGESVVGLRGGDQHGDRGEGDARDHRDGRDEPEAVANPAPGQCRS